ncbi:TetR/AcrR family transcriptional regulator [Mesorhizobium sp. 43Arga]
MKINKPVLRKDRNGEPNPMPAIARKALKPRTKPAEVRRDDILRAATSLFVAKGVGTTTIDAIATRAEVAKGTFYLYFTSKEDVVAALRGRFVAGFRARVLSAIEACPPDDWTGRLKSFVSAGIDAYLDDHRLHDVVFHDHRPDQRQMKGDNPLLGDLSACWRPARKPAPGRSTIRTSPRSSCSTGYTARSITPSNAACATAASSPQTFPRCS